MISGDDITNGVGGTLAMAKADPSWSERLEMSAEQVFKSFWALPLAIPANLLAVEGTRRILMSEGPAEFLTVGPWPMAFSQTILMIATWCVELGLLVSLAGRRGAGWRISPLIIGYNWTLFLSRTAQGLLVGTALLLNLLWLTQLATVVATVFGIWLLWGVIKRPLETTPMGTVGVIALLVVVSTVTSLLFALVFQAVGLLPSADLG